MRLRLPWFEVNMVAVTITIVEFPIVLVMVIVILMSSSCGPKGPKSWLKGLKIGSEGPPTKNPQRSPRFLVSDIA